MSGITSSNYLMEVMTRIEAGILAKLSCAHFKKKKQ